MQAMELPQGPMILFSFVNTKLRDDYPSLEAFCKAFGVEKEELVHRLAEAGFEYNEQQNKFW